MSGWRNWPHFYETRSAQSPGARPARPVNPWPSSPWLPEPLSIATVPQPHRRADLRAALPQGGAGRSSGRGVAASLSVATPGPTRDRRWLIPVAVFAAIAVVVKWWSARR